MGGLVGSTGARIRSAAEMAEAGLYTFHPRRSENHRLPGREWKWSGRRRRVLWRRVLQKESLYRLGSRWLCTVDFLSSDYAFEIKSCNTAYSATLSTMLVLNLDILFARHTAAGEGYATRTRLSSFSAKTGLDRTDDDFFLFHIIHPSTML